MASYVERTWLLATIGIRKSVAGHNDDTFNEHLSSGDGKRPRREPGVSGVTGSRITTRKTRETINDRGLVGMYE
jgi:hypothetical protein